jgi:hypothetical protein
MAQKQLRIPEGHSLSWVMSLYHSCCKPQSLCKLKPQSSDMCVIKEFGRTLLLQYWVNCQTLLRLSSVKWSHFKMTFWKICWTLKIISKWFYFLLQSTSISKLWSWTFKLLTAHTFYIKLQFIKMETSKNLNYLFWQNLNLNPELVLARQVLLFLFCFWDRISLTLSRLSLNLWLSWFSLLNS